MQSNIRTKLAEALLKDLSSDENKRTRKKLQKARPQVLFLENLNFINDTIKELTTRGHLDVDISLIEFDASDLEKARRVADKYQASYIKRNLRYPKGAKNLENTMGGKHLQKKFPMDYKKVKNRQAFICSSFAQIGKCKKELIDLFVKTTDHNIKKIRASVDRGHGASDGLAVSGVQIAQGMGRAQKSFGDDEEAKKLFQQEFKTFISDSFTEGDLKLSADEITDLLKVTIEYEQIVTPSGKISATYLPFITFQDKYRNRTTDQARETIIKKVVEKFFKKVGTNERVSMQGSSSLRDKMLSKAIEPLVTIDAKNKKVKISTKIDPRKVKLKTGGKVDVAQAAGGVAAFKISKGKKAKSKPKGKVQKATTSSYSVAAIMGNINAKLPQTVADNMGAPALEYRTGTFAASVRVTDVVKTPKGFPSIGYTYQKGPYSVFESTSGSRFADVHRDPRVIIDKSIREIAAEMALGRLFTRRV